jgi:hypothetical protein
MKVTDKHTGHVLSPKEVLAEINRDRSAEWTDYVDADLHEGSCAYGWIDTDYYILERIKP